MRSLLFFEPVMPGKKTYWLARRRQTRVFLGPIYWSKGRYVFAAGEEGGELDGNALSEILEFINDRMADHVKRGGKARF
jgi:hypothetical protein